MTITGFDPARASAEERAAWVSVMQAAWAVEHPEEPPLPARFWLTSATSTMDGLPTEAWTARDRSGRVVGAATLALPAQDNTHAGLVDLVVHPAHRRAGVGRALLDHLAARARAAGRRLLIGEALDPSAGPAFARAVGAELGLVEVRRVLDLPVAPELLRSLHDDAAKHADGYALVRWRGPTPPEHRADVLTLAAHMSDAPVDDLDYDREVWDEARLAVSDRYVEDVGARSYVVAARDDATGRLVAYTLVLVHAEADTWAWQEGTVVLPGHRGRRLGTLVKTEMHAWLADAEPQLRRIDTGNAGTNPWMVAINERLGYRVLDHWQEWQLTL